MIKTDPIIAVKDVRKSSNWYQKVFGCKSIHGGDKFDVLKDEQGGIIICLHKWGEHDHPTMIDAALQPGNGLILYFRTDKLDMIRENVKGTTSTIEEEIQTNPNTGKREFTLRDLDGYYLIISEFHNY